jgi:hypothetical protein
MRPRLGLYALPPGIVALWQLAIAISGLFAVVVLAMVIYTGRFTVGWQMGFAAVQIFALLPLPLIALNNLSQSRRVLMLRAAPLSTWRQEVRAVCGTLFSAWLITSACSLIVMLMVQSNIEEVAAVMVNGGLLALLMAWVILIAAPQMGLRAAAWLLPLIPLLFIGKIRASGLQFADLQAFPWLTLGVGLTLLLAALAWLHHCTVRTPQAQPDHVSVSRGTWLKDLARRFRMPLIDRDQQPFVLLPTLIASQLPLMMQSSFYLLSKWDDDISAWNLVRVLLMMAYAGMLLSSNDLHVRNLLAPGGVFRRRLGQRIVGSTLVSAALFAGIVLGVFLLFAYLLSIFFGNVRFIPSPSSALPTAGEMVLAVSMTTLMRGYLTTSPKLSVLLTWVFVVAVMLLMWAAGLFTFRGHPPSFGIVGPTYIVCLLSLAALFTAASNRVWARADLAGLYRKQQKPDALPDNGW